VYAQVRQLERTQSQTCQHWLCAAAHIREYGTWPRKGTVSHGLRVGIWVSDLRHTVLKVKPSDEQVRMLDDLLALLPHSNATTAKGTAGTQPVRATLLGAALTALPQRAGPALVDENLQPSATALQESMPELPAPRGMSETEFKSAVQQVHVRRMCDVQCLKYALRHRIRFARIQVREYVWL
jgi:hypothetical protein